MGRASLSDLCPNTFHKAEAGVRASGLIFWSCAGVVLYPIILEIKLGSRRRKKRLVRD